MSVRISASDKSTIRFILRHVLLLLCMAMTFWPLWDEYRFIPELLGQARLYLTFSYIVILLLFLWRKRWFACVLMAGIIGFNLYWMYSSFHMGSQTVVLDKAAPRLRMLSFNVYKDNSNPDAIGSMVRSVNPDVVLLVEAEGRLEGKAIEQLAPDYPFRFTRRDAREYISLALFSKYPFKMEQRPLTRGSEQKVFYAEIDFRGQPVQFYGVHPISPKNLDRTITRNIQLRKLAAHIMTQANPDLPLIVAGDFNTAPWQNGMRDFQRVTHLVNTDNFGNITLTWPTWLPPVFGVPIDHILHNSWFCSGEKHKLPATGSDHYPVWADLYLCRNP